MGAEHKHDEHNHTCELAHSHSGAGMQFIETAFLFFSLSFLILFYRTEQMRTMSVVFVSIVLEAFPFVLIGSLIGGLIEAYVSRDKLTAFLEKRGVFAVFIGAGMGIIFPVCECAIVPVVRRLLRKGVPFSAAIAYLLAGPIVNPTVATSTAFAYPSVSSNTWYDWFDWKVVAMRVGCGYLIAVVVGLFMGRLFRGGSALVEDGGSEDACCIHATGGSRIGAALRHAADDFLDIGRFLVMGAIIAAVTQTLISRKYFLMLSGNPVASILVMMSLAVLLNLCSEADAFVASSFRQFFPMSAQMGFMVLGPMLDIKLVFMYLGVFRRKAIIALSLSTTVAVFIVMLMLHYLVLGGGS